MNRRVAGNSLHREFPKLKKEIKSDSETHLGIDQLKDSKLVPVGTVILAD